MPEISEIKIGQDIGKGNKKNYYSWLACIDCGKERWVQVNRGKPCSKHCQHCQTKIARIALASKPVSEETKLKMSEAHKGLNWKGGKSIRRVCEQCGSIFYVYPSDRKRGRARFCGIRCRAIYAQKHGMTKPPPRGIIPRKFTKPERILAKLLEENKLPFKYVGDGSVWLDNRNPDFININGKKQIIEVFGTYWHPVFDVAQRTEHYKQYGFSTLIIWADELKDLDKVLAKVRRFARLR